MLKLNDILKSMELMQSHVIAKNLTEEKEFDVHVKFEIGNYYENIKLSFNEHRVMLNIHLDREDKLINRLKYYLKKRGKDSFNSHSSFGQLQHFQFSFDTYDEFLLFYKKYLT